MTALIPFWMLLELDYTKVLVATIKKNSHRKFRGLSQIIFPTVSVIMTLRGGGGV